MKTSKEVHDDYAGRRRAILRALTTEVDRFYAQCDPNKENLCLYGYPDGTWAVDLPAEEVPPEAPEPALGINFARDGMQKKDWLGLVAVHSDSWLLALAFYKGARLNKAEREELFSMINSQPTLYEVVSGRAVRSGAAGQPQPGSGGAAAGAGGFYMPKMPPSGPGTNPQKKPRMQESMPKVARTSQSEEEEEEEEPDGSTGGGGAAWEDGEGDPCPTCGRLYRTDEFWIACDFCDTWYCGRCAKMTQAKAEKTKNWKCNNCTGRNGG